MAISRGPFDTLPISLDRLCMGCHVNNLQIPRREGKSIPCLQVASQRAWQHALKQLLSIHGLG